MRRFPEELGKLGFVFNFITYGGHQIDGLAAEEFATALRAGRHAGAGAPAAEVPPGRVALPDAADAGRRSARSTRRSWPSSGRTATTKAMGKGSTQYQHLVQTEVPTKLLEEWLALWAQAPPARRTRCASSCGRTRAGSELLELSLCAPGDGEGRQRHLRAHPGPPRPQHPLDARPEHVRRRAAQEAADDAGPPVPDPPLQGGLGALREPDRGQPATRRRR